MELNELEELKKMNELDLLYKIIDVANSTKKRTEQVLKGNNVAGSKVRAKMQDIRLLAEQIRTKVQIRKGLGDKKINFKGYVIDDTPVDKAIILKIKSIEKEDLRIKALEEERKKNTLT